MSVADQERDGRRFCEQQGWEVAWSLTDNDLSASRTAKRERPGYAEVQRRLSAPDRVDILVAWESSRLQRDLEVYVQVRNLCETYGVLWAYSGRVFDLSRTDDRFTTGLDALLAERYASETSDKVQRAVNSRVESGRPHGRVGYGYRSVHDKFSGVTIGRVIDDEAAPVVREIARRVLSGEPNASIARDLNARGVPSPHALRVSRLGKSETPRPWTVDQIRRIVMSPANAGYREHKGAITGEANWEPIITPSDHRSLVALMTAPERRTIREREIKYLLTGIALCGVCGSRCRRVANRKSPSYVCWGSGTGHYCVSRSQELVDALVTETLLDRIRRPDAVEALALGDDMADLREARAELDALEARLEEFRIAAESPKGLPAATLARIENRLGPLIEAARVRAFPPAVPAVVRDLITASEPHAVWSTYSANKRRQVVKRLIRVTILPVLVRGTHDFDPTRIQVEWL